MFGENHFIGSFGYAKVKRQELKISGFRARTNDMSEPFVTLRWIQVSLQCGEGRSQDTMS